MFKKLYLNRLQTHWTILTAPRNGNESNLIIGSPIGEKSY